MEYIKMPNLPAQKVHSVLVAQNCPHEIINELTSYGIEPILGTKIDILTDATRTHPDMQILHMGENRFICAKEVFDYYNKTLKNANITALSGEITPKYPKDAALNTALIGNSAFLCKKSINEHIFEEVVHMGLQVIAVNQGYTKCNLVPVTNNALITEDVSIYKAAIENAIDALYIESGKILLDGYAHGFLGGACGKLADDTLAITGKLSYLPEASQIRSFCKNHGVDIIELSQKQPRDIGSILPIA